MELPELKVLLRVQLLLLSYYASGEYFFFFCLSPFLRYEACICWTGGCSHVGLFLEDVKCFPPLYQAEWAWTLAFTWMFNPQLPCTGFHAPKYDWYCCPRRGRCKDLLPPLLPICWTPFSLQVVSIKSLLKDVCNFSMNHRHAPPPIDFHRDSQAIWMPSGKLLAVQAPFTRCFEMAHFALVIVKMCNTQLKCAIQLQIYREQLQHEILQTSQLVAHS